MVTICVVSRYLEDGFGWAHGAARRLCLPKFLCLHQGPQRGMEWEGVIHPWREKNEISAWAIVAPGEKKEEYKKKMPKTALQQLKSKVEWNTRAAKEVVKVLRSIRNTQLLSDSTFESWVLKASKATQPPKHPHRLCFYGVHKVFSRLWWDFSSILFILQVCLINKWTL